MSPTKISEHTKSLITEYTADILILHVLSLL